MNSAQWVAAACAGLGMFLAALDISVNVALPTITSSFKTDLHTVQWVIVAFIATRAGLVMGAGGFADRFGLKPVYLFGTATYLASMISIAMSPSLEMVVGFRVLQAVGTGCLYAVSPAIAARVFSARRRGLAMGLTSASQALGMLAGTLGAGLLVRWFGWEAVFLGRTPFTVLAIILGVKLMAAHKSPAAAPSVTGEGTGIAERLPFDLPGAVTLLATVLCLVIGLRLGRSVGWTSPLVLLLLALAPLFLAAFRWAERRATSPLLPVDLFRSRGFVSSGSSMLLAHLGVFVIWFIFPFYISDGLGRGPMTLGVLLAMMASLSIWFSGIGGWLCDRVGPLPVGSIGLVILAAGLLWMGFLDGGSGLTQVGLRISVVGAGLGLFQAAAYSMMLGSVPPERFGMASGALSLAQALGTVLSVAIIGGVFSLSQEYHLKAATEAPSPQDQGVEAFLQASRDVFRLGAAVAGVGALVFLGGIPKNRLIVVRKGTADHPVS